MTIIDFNKIVEISGRTKAWALSQQLSGESAMKAVKQDGYALQFVKDQTEAICIEAVKQDGRALQFVDFGIG